ncbi:MerR family transcriptional regulator [Oecophyllibacter saccharovorans]|uniref:MerR family transcriptional regulator n=1 Tax=Oecophyllibacter saccharovorans TaxID=2558360 RepID=A0A506UR78_9PROT|nr:MerR family transcriptional regulator [Oecophyllibacter saccharovorans]TPW35779.1 MerR family transcriptional regulator [Oecophyllibacter saccharovorans]
MSEAGRNELTLEQVAEIVGQPGYRLRSWENLYPVFQAPIFRNGTRYYTAADLEKMQRIAGLLYEGGHKRHEIMRLLRKEGLVPPQHQTQVKPPLSELEPEGSTPSAQLGQPEKATSQVLEEQALEETANDAQVALRQQVEEAQKGRHLAEAQLQRLQTELSGALQLVGEENARLQGEVEALKSRKEAEADAPPHTNTSVENAAEDQQEALQAHIMRLEEDLAQARLRQEQSTAAQDRILTAAKEASERLRTELAQHKTRLQELENLPERLKVLEESRRRLQEQLASRHAESREEMAALTASLQERERLLLEKEEQLEALRREKQQLEEQKDILAESLRKSENASVEAAQLQERLQAESLARKTAEEEGARRAEALEMQLQQQQAAETTRAETEKGLKAEIDLLEQQLSHTEEQLTRLTMEKENSAQRALDLEKELQALIQRNQQVGQEAETRRAEWQARGDRLEAEAALLKQQLEESRQQHEQFVTEVQADLAHEKGQATQLKAELELARERHKTLEETAERAMSTCEGQAAELAGCRAELESLRQSLETAQQHQVQGEQMTDANARLREGVAALLVELKELRSLFLD